MKIKFLLKKGMYAAILILTLTNQMFAQSLSAGRYHSLSLCPDSSVNAWGYNNYGTLGNNSGLTSYTAVSVYSLTSIYKISAGTNFSLGLKKNGTIASWGRNNIGQLGNSTLIDASIPVNVLINNVSEISAGNNHALALKTDGTVWAWGSNVNGELGNGTTTNTTSPVQVSSLNNVIAISAGKSKFSLALKNDGTVWAWGTSYAGILGIGPVVQSYTRTPAQVHLLSNITAIATGEEFSLALKNDSTVWAWGVNTYGQLGNGTTTAANEPILINGLTSVVKIYAGYNYAYAVKKNGTVWVWGNGTNGNFGDGNFTSSNVPIQVTSLNNIDIISPGALHTLFKQSSGNVSACGDNSNGVLGNGTTVSSSSMVSVSQLCLLSTSVKENQQSVFSIYPNPSREILNIKLEMSNEEPTDIKIFNMFGETVLSETITSNNLNVKTNNLKSGVYFVTLTNQGKQSTKKIIIE